MRQAAAAALAGILLGTALPAGLARAATPAPIEEGASLFRTNCSSCHGVNARGGARGPSLTSGRWVHGSSDAAISRTINQGVAGTAMPASNFEGSETRAIVAYLRSLTPPSAPQTAGDRARGQQIFFGKGACSGCHMVNGNGGRLGPDLTRVGAARSAAYLIDSIREPDKELSDGMLDPNNRFANALVYDTVTVVTRTGQHIVGIARNEDVFSIQLLDTHQQLQLLLKKDLESVTHERRSLMPAYTEATLSDTELGDLVLYLEGLRGDLPVAALAEWSTSEGATYERILNAPLEAQSWLTYSGRYSGWRYSSLDQINAGNVARLRLEWAFQTAELGQFETTPLVVDGVLYGTGQNNRAFALDARTGRAIWRYQRNLPEALHACCGMVNRGFAMLGNTLFMATLDAHVVALDAKTGNVLWDVAAADSRKGYAFNAAPLAVKDKVIVGVSGGEYGVRGFIDAYDAKSGRRVWRFDTVPGPGKPGHETWTGDSWKTGGAPAWVTGSFDPELNLIYWPTGNPAPSNYGGARGGDNLYSNCMLALDVDSGKLKWFFQFTPHDVHDYDATQIPLLIDSDWQERPRKLLIQANRNGFVYVLDRSDGTFLSARPFGHITWAKGIDTTGRPVIDPAAQPDAKGVEVCPGPGGLTNWYSPSYNPGTRALYVVTSDECDVFSAMPQPYRAGHDFIGSVYVTRPDKRPSGTIDALDPFTGQKKWQFKVFSAPAGGTLSTAGGLVLAGDADGNFIALEALTGKDLWRIQLGAAIYSTAVTYLLDGKQYVVVPAGAGLFAFALPTE